MSAEPTITKIEVDRELCIGAATCVAVAPQLFALDGENKAVVRPADGATDAAILNAAKSCPVLAIYCYNQAGQRVFPAD